MIAPDTCAVCDAPLPSATWHGGPLRLYCSAICSGRADYARLLNDPARASRRRAYGRWRAMHTRCYDATSPKFERYGGRGIYVCAEWHDFETYYADTGDAPEGMTLDRVDNDGPYSPDNTRWATAKQQRANQAYDHMRIKTRCKNGHPFDELNTYVDRRGWRACRACARAKAARQRAERKVAP